jgi:integrase
VSGEGSIYEYPLGSGRWYAALHVNGRRRKRGPTSRIEATQKLRDLHALRDQAFEIDAGSQRLADYLEMWLREVVQPQLRPKTHRTYADQVRLHINPALEHLRLDKLRPQDVQLLLNRLRASGLSPATVNQTRRVLRRALEQARQWRLIRENPVDLTAPPKAAAPEWRILTPEQARTLLSETAANRLSALYTLSLTLGLRQGEALALRWRDIDLEAQTLTVQHQLQRVEGQLRLVEPKSKRSMRTIALPDVAVRGLREHHTRQLEERLRAGLAWQEADLVFCTSIGTPIIARNLLRSFKRHLEEAGLPDVRWHDLRHTAASVLAAQGVHQRTVMEILGHSTTAMTMEIYTHVLPEWQRDAVAKMDDVFPRGAAAAS